MVYKILNVKEDDNMSLTAILARAKRDANIRGLVGTHDQYDPQACMAFLQKWLDQFLSVYKPKQKK